jgi:hypothetical protein
MPDGCDTPLVWNGVVSSPPTITTADEREAAHADARVASFEGEEAAGEEPIVAVPSGTTPA